MQNEARPCIKLRDMDEKNMHNLFLKARIIIIIIIIVVVIVMIMIMIMLTISIANIIIIMNIFISSLN
jgi:hypothetical protein